MTVTTLKYLLFVGAFVGIAGLLLPMISETAESAELGDVEYAEGDTGRLYVMKTPANYVRTLFSLNPGSSVVIGQLDFYFYADHDVTYYYDGTENNFTLYIDITDPNSGTSQTESWENFNPAPPHNYLQYAGHYLENVNLSWDNDYSVIIDVADERSTGAGNVLWTYPMVVRGTVPSERVPQTFFRWMIDVDAWGRSAALVGTTIADGARRIIFGAFSAVVGQDVAGMVGSFFANMGRVLTMDFGGIPNIIRLMLALPIWLGFGYISLIIVRSFIPTVGGGSHG